MVTSSALVLSELASDTFDVHFAPLTVRGTYRATIGPAIADLAGNTMSSAYTTSLEYVSAGVVFTEEQTSCVSLHVPSSSPLASLA